MRRPDPIKDYKSLKLIVIVMVMALAFYPVFELTRYIVQYNIIAGVSKVIWNTYAELGLIWGGYLLIPFFLNKMFKLMEKILRKKYLDQYLESMEKKSEIELGVKDESQSQDAQAHR